MAYEDPCGFGASSRPDFYAGPAGSERICILEEQVKALEVPRNQEILHQPGQIKLWLLENPYWTFVFFSAASQLCLHVLSLPGARPPTKRITEVAPAWNGHSSCFDQTCPSSASHVFDLRRFWLQTNDSTVKV